MLVRALVYLGLMAGIFSNSVSDAAAQARNNCKRNPHLVGDCFKVHGRLSWTNGSSAKLWRIGTNRLLGVPCWHSACMPDSLHEKLDADVVVFGDYEVCPLTKE
jgi:hypothetical protein